MPCLSSIITSHQASCQPLLEAVKQAPTLAHLVLAAGALGRFLAACVVEAVLEERAQAPTVWPLCPQCGSRLVSKGLVARQITTLVGLVRWRRRVARCPQGCSLDPQVVPLDEELGLVPQQRTGTELQRVGCALAVFVPFEIAALLVGLIAGVPVSPEGLWGWVQAAGQRAMDELQRELEQLGQGVLPEEEAMDAATAALPLLIGADGVRVPFRSQARTPRGKTVWREIKVGILARLGRRTTATGGEEPRLERRRVVAVRGDIHALSPRLWLEAVRQGVLSARTVAWLSDGGHGLWGLFSARFSPYAYGILDFYHAAQNLWKGAAAWLDGRTKRARHWFVTARHALRHGGLETVLADLTAALATPGLPAAAQTTLTNLYLYLDTHREHVDYERFQALGLPLGSGLVESACKWLIQQRFKGVGMRWSEEGFNHLLHLRLAWVNGRFDTLFSLEVSPKP